MIFRLLVEVPRLLRSDRGLEVVDFDEAEDLVAAAAEVAAEGVGKISAR